MPKKIEQIDAEYTQIVQQIGHKIYVKHQLDREIVELNSQADALSQEKAKAKEFQAELVLEKERQKKEADAALAALKSPAAPIAEQHHGEEHA